MIIKIEDEFNQSLEFTYHTLKVAINETLTEWQ